MEFILVTPTGAFEVVPELKISNAIACYGSTPPTVAEVRRISVHYIKLLMDAMERIIRRPNMTAITKTACLVALRDAMRDNAAFSCKYSAAA